MMGAEPAEEDRNKSRGGSKTGQDRPTRMAKAYLAKLLHQRAAEEPSRLSRHDLGDHSTTHPFPSTLFCLIFRIGRGLANVSKNSSSR